jgi:hypothetical protein
MEPEGFNTEITGYHGGDSEEYYLLGCDAGKVLLDYTALNSRQYYSFIIVFTKSLYLFLV